MQRVNYEGKLVIIDETFIELGNRKISYLYVFSRPMICLSLRLGQIIGLLATGKQLIFSPPTKS